MVLPSSLFFKFSFPGWKLRGDIYRAAAETECDYAEPQAGGSGLCRSQRLLPGSCQSCSGTRKTQAENTSALKAVGALQREDALGLRPGSILARPRGREAMQEVPELLRPTVGHRLGGILHSLYVIFPQLYESGTTSSFDRCSAELVKVRQLRSGGTTCV